MCQQREIAVMKVSSSGTRSRTSSGGSSGGVCAKRAQRRDLPTMLLRAGGAAALAAAVALAAPAPSTAAGQVGETPYDQSKRILLGPTADGRVRPCGINPNCLSSANLDDLYGPPWRSPAATPQAAAAALEVAVPEAVRGAQLARATALEGGEAEYRAFTAPGLFGEDVMEFVARPADKGGSSGGVLVTYRSQAGTIKYLYPFTQPIGDGGLQKKHLAAVREALGWRVEGCSYLECYGG